MRFTLSWLHDFLETKASLEEITTTLTSIGLEVEEVIDYTQSLADFKVGEILEAIPHPEANNLQICKVNNSKEILQIICGAPNARAGIKVVLASIGCVIPLNGMKIKQAKIRNIDSCGMMCSARELGLEDEANAIIELDSDAIVGENFTKSYGINDPIIEVSITPNRGDCLGVYGIARDLAAAGIGKLRDIETPEFKSEFDSPIKLGNVACELFAGYYFKNISNNQSPKWLKNRLNSIGKSSISVLVDITNYINYSFARPLHVYDADKITGNIHVRPAVNEKIMALNDVEYQLDEHDIIVADDHGPIAIAGIMGGKDSSCSLDSRNIFLESALFDVDLLTNSGRKHKIESDSRYRFERQIDGNFTILGAKLAAKMILELAGGEISNLVVSSNNILKIFQELDLKMKGERPECTEEYMRTRNPDIFKKQILKDEEYPYKFRELSFNPAKVKTLGGIELSLDKIKDILTKLGFVIKDQGEILHLTIPSWRNDIAIEADIIEEILRINGFDNIPLAVLPRHATIYSNALPEKLKRTSIIRRKLASAGMSEVISWSFMPVDVAKLFGPYHSELELQNPISSELSYMRNSIIGNLIEITKKNANRSINNLAIFEIGSVFLGTTPETQHKMISGIRVGKNSQKNIYNLDRKYDFYDVKSDVALILEEGGISFENINISDNVPEYYHPKRSASISLGKLIIGYVGELHPELLTRMDCDNNVVGFEIFIDNLPVSRAKHGRKPAYIVSDYQVVSRDFAFIVDRDFAADKLVKLIKSSNNPLIREVSIFDVYMGDKIDHDKKSIAINILIQAQNRTLNEDEIAEFSKNIIEMILTKANAQLRQ